MAIATFFAAVHESAYGHIVTDHIVIGDGRFRGEADMPRARAAYRSVEFDPSLSSADQFCCDAQRGIPVAM